MLFDIFLIASSLLIGSTVSGVVAKMLVYQRGFDLFSGSIQGIQLFTASFGQAKTFDLIEFILFVLISFGVFTSFFLVYRNNKFTNIKKNFVGGSLLIFAFIVSLATLFASYSGTQTLVLIAVWCFATVLVSFKIPENIPIWNEGKMALYNGIVTGFYLSILLHKFTTSVSLPLSVFAIIPIYFYLFLPKYNFLKNPSFLILILSFIFPFNVTFLFVLIPLTAILVFFTHNRIPLKFSKFIETVYPSFILFIFLYNPTFYMGSFDTVEEGFWAGWLQRMLQGLAMYRDFAIYHPPLLPGGLYIFSKIFGASLYNMRLYFNLLQIVG
jgi:hypothetical protein